MIRIKKQSRSDKSIDTDNFNRMVDMVNQLSRISISGGTIRYDPSGVYISVEPPAAATDYSDWAFGYSASGAVVTVNAGSVRHGTRTPASVAETPVTITADHTIIYVKSSFAGSATLEVSTSELIDTESIHYHPLHKWRLVNGVAGLEAGCIYSLGNIVDTGAFG